MIVSAGAFFLLLLDSSILNTSLPQVAVSMGVQPLALSPTITGYLLASVNGQQMFDVVMSRASTQDVFIAVAAVADWRVKDVSARKLKKSVDAAPHITFEQNPDILAAVAALPQKPYCVGFAAESEELLKYGKSKRERKGIPLLVGNIGHETFGLDDNELIIFDAMGHVHLPRASKQSLARRLIAEISERITTLTTS